MKKMNRKNRKGIAVLTAAVMTITMTVTTAAPAFATDGNAWLALGASLSDSEKATVLDLLDVESTDNYNIIYVTNDEEHQYLDSYVDSSQIGSRALSSVLIQENDGDDIDVDTINIGYCTEGMYENALETAGVSGADVTVAGPFEISGTAALVGIIKAYEEMTGEDVSDEVIEGAVDEITTTGEIGDEIGDKETAEEIISDVKEELAANPDMSVEEIKEAVQEAAAEEGVELSDETLDKAVEMIKKLQGLDIDWNSFADKAEELMNSGFFDKIIEWIRSFFQ